MKTPILTVEALINDLQKYPKDAFICGCSIDDGYYSGPCSKVNLASPFEDHSPENDNIITPLNSWAKRDIVAVREYHTNAEEFLNAPLSKQVWITGVW